MYSGLEIYKIPSFAGMAIINGILLKIFSPTLLGMQIINSIYTSGICVLLYLLGKELSERGSIIGSILYAIYPMSVISTAVTTNHHGATFFLLLAIYLQGKIDKGRMWNIIFCALCLVISNFYHPSIILTFIALLLFSFVKDFSNIKVLKQDIINREILKSKTIGTLIVIVLYYLIWSMLMFFILNSGYVKNTSETSMLGKFVVGFNFETVGRTSQEDQDLLLSLSEEEQDRVCIEIVKERLKEHSLLEIAELMLKKNSNTWFNNDDYTWFLLYEKNLYLDTKIAQTTDPGLKLILENEKWNLNILYNDMVVSDTMFVILIWGCAIIGIITMIIRNKNDILYLYLLIPMGWMAFIMLTEQQARYRYQGMTIIVMMAGMGVNYFISKFESYKKSRGN